MSLTPQEMIYLAEIKELIMNCQTRKELENIVFNYKLYDSNVDINEISNVNTYNSANLANNVLDEFDNYDRVIKLYSLVRSETIDLEEQQKIINWLSQDNNLVVLDEIIKELNVSESRDIKQLLDFTMKHYEENGRCNEYIDYFCNNYNNLYEDMNIIPSSFIVYKQDLESKKNISKGVEICHK